MKPGTTVAFTQAVIRRTDADTAKARGVVLEVKGNLARVDFKGTWIAHEDGSTVRTVPVANLTVILSNGAVFGD
jgi:Cu2+-containing amine oxidase